MQKNNFFNLLGIYLVLSGWFSLALETVCNNSLTPAEKYAQKKPSSDQFLSKWMKMPIKEELKVVAIIGNGLDTFDFSILTTMINFIPNTRVKTIAKTKDPIITGEGTTIIPDYDYNDEFDVDVLSMVAGTGPNPETSAFIRKIAPKVKKFIFTICQGSETLADSGMLDGRKATVTKMFFSRAKKNYPKVNWVRTARFVEDGNIITTSGGAAGLDGVFALITKLYDEETARKVIGMNEYRWDPNPMHDGFEDFGDLYPLPPLPSP